MMLIIAYCYLLLSEDASCHHVIPLFLLLLKEVGSASRLLLLDKMLSAIDSFTSVVRFFSCTL
ncbi:hypothetical protein BD770DRAFT_381962, partial [Pilaira anomala]